MNKTNRTYPLEERHYKSEGRNSFTCIRWHNDVVKNIVEPKLEVEAETCKKQREL